LLMHKGGSIMNEFILLIRNDIDHQAAWSPEQHQQFFIRCKDYIEKLTKEGQLKSAQPLVSKDKIIADSKEPWKAGPLNETKEVIVGYYHIFAEAMNDAFVIAKGNPEFEYASTARIDICPIKMWEESIG
jgi:hypothetical protein